MAVNGGVFWHLRPQVFEFGFLPILRAGDTALFVERDALFQGRVVESATLPQNLPKLTGLFGRRLEFVLVGLAQTQTLTHGYCSFLCRSAYSRSAQIISPLKERSCFLASARIAFNTSNGKRIEIRVSCLRVPSMYLFYHNIGYAEIVPDFWLKPLSVIAQHDSCSEEQAGQAYASA